MLQTGFRVLLAAAAAAQVCAEQIPLSTILTSSHDLEFETTIANTPGFDIDFSARRLVHFAADKGAEPVWITERQKYKAKAAGYDFFDLTDTPALVEPHPIRKTFQYPPVKNATTALVKRMIPMLSTDGPRANLRTFTGFHTRFYASDYGKASSEWLLNRIQSYIAELATEEQKAIITANAFKHSFKQTSVIIRFSPKNTTLHDPITVIGAHCDSISHADPTGRSPGADDDGSGTVTILEAFRGLLVAGYIPISPLEFQFYAAEEGGLLGSLGVVDAYVADNRTIKGMLQFDMTAWVKAGTREEIGIITNEVNPILTDYIRTLLDKYIHLPYVDTQYARGGTDHMSWTRGGYQSANILESQFKNANLLNVHTFHDTLDISPEFSFEHMLHFIHLALAFAVELSSY